MLTRNATLVLTCALGLGACTVPPPTAPTVLATPPAGKDLARFQQEDLNCRQYAYGSTGNPGQTAGNAAVGSAAVGTAVGAAAGALIGAAAGNPGAGAAVGAGAGLVTGSAVGANQARAVGYSAQQIYDMAYAQCMTAAGNQIQGPVAPAYGVGGYYPYPSYGYYGAAYPYWGYPYWGWGFGPTVVVGSRWGWGGGWGWHRGWGGGWRGGWGGGWRGGWHGRR